MTNEGNTGTGGEGGGRGGAVARDGGDEATALWRAKSERDERAEARAQKRALPALALAVLVGLLLMVAGLWIVAFR